MMYCERHEGKERFHAGNELKEGKQENGTSKRNEVGEMEARKGEIIAAYFLVY
jgi:hypothetical protein